MMKKIYLIHLMFLLMFTSCSREKWLDIKPKAKVILKTVEDYRKLLNFTGVGSSSFPSFGGGYSGTDLTSDDFIITDATKFLFSLSKTNQYTWSDNIYLSNEDDPDWKRLYGQIYATNIITEGVMKAIGGTEKEKLRLLAEAKVHKAFSYFSLVNLYGPHYVPNASSDVAVPLRLGTELTGVNLSRVSVQKIYDLVLKSLKSSIPNLPNKPKYLAYNFRPTKQGAYAFLARVYLYMGKYSKSLEAVSHALSINSTITDFNNNKKDDLKFAIKITPKDPNMWALIPNQPYEDPQLLWKKGGRKYNTLIPSDDLYNLYEDNDLRKKLYIPLSKYLSRDDNKEYIFKKALYSHKSIRFRGVGLTVPEVLLTQAECNVRLGNVKLAVDALNRLREKRFVTGTYIPITSTNQSEVLNLVKKERRIELAGNGLRYFDLKRYNQFDNANISLTRVLGGKTYTLRAGSKNWAFPIAQKYILQTPEIGKNNRD